MKNLNIILGLILLAVLISCSKDDNKDNQAPYIEVMAPTEDQMFLRGGHLTLDAIFQDNEALKECRVNLLFDEAMPDTLKSATGIDLPWEPEEMVIPLSETYQEVTNLVLFGGQIPIEIQSGYYNLQFDVYDLAKNPARHSVRVFIN
ncbi:DUF4625 domain-containing protein [Saccharicrinis aurantiacus]|uniref:DUF4625 domain-containing protein n=1 Tax=Saccharicrinis aurantiacus TaxID=1849719 RepID=UPI00094FF558|nr:DUF4625 domain-containing protein [Saccharicrinis aurantiacus]